MKVKEVIDVVNNNKEVFIDMWSLTDEDVLDENNIKLGDCVTSLPG